MRLENLVWDAVSPQHLGHFWAGALAAELLTDTPALVEARLTLAGGQFLDLCFPQVPAPSGHRQRLHPDLIGGAQRDAVVERLLGLGATPADIGQGEVPWVVLADPEGNPFCVMEDRECYPSTAGPIAALPLESGDPERDGEFWAALTGWHRVDGAAPYSLRHPSGSGPLLELCPETEPRRGKSPLHLDVRPDPGDQDPLALVRDLGGTVLAQPAPGLHWTVCADPSGNEVCLLGVVAP